MARRKPPHPEPPRWGGEWLPGSVRGPLGWVHPSGLALRSGRKILRHASYPRCTGGRTGEEGREGGRAENGGFVNWAFMRPMLRPVNANVR